MSLMSGLYVGTSGLQTGQNALNTTAHNLSNTDTTGFVRQQALQSDKVYNKLTSSATAVTSQQVGLGVTYATVRQVRDFFLDQSYRRESGRSAFYDTSYKGITEIEDLLDEMNDDASFNYSLTQFWSTLQELSKTPDDTTVQRMLVQNAQTLLTSSQQVYKGLTDYQNEVNQQISGLVNDINNYGKDIISLNNQISAIEAGGIETANDLRDARNLILDKLGCMANISYSEDTFGNVSVQIEGTDFIAGGNLYAMNVVKDSQTGFYTPYWEIFATTASEEDGVDCFRDGDVIVNISRARVYDTNQIISSENNTDIGQLRSLMYLRGDKNANYTDIPTKPAIPSASDFENDVDYRKAVEDYNEEMTKYEEKVEYYNKYIAQSVCMNIEAELDQLVHNVVTTVNDILASAADTTTGYMCEMDDNGNYYPIQLFQKVATEGYTYNEISGKYEYNEEITDDKSRTDTLYSITNLQINPALLREAGKLKFVFDDGTVDYETAKKLVDAFDKDNYVLNPNVTTKCSLNTYYSNLVSQVANSGYVYRSIAESQEATVNSIANSREQVIGVSSDEELSNMIKFQNAYNASSRYINVIDEMLEHLLNALG